MNFFNKLRSWSKKLKEDSYALYLAYKDPRAGLFPKVFAFVVIAYFFSPIDLIPDFIPIVGYIDDVILIPLGLFIAIKLMPAEVMEDARKKAKNLYDKEKPKNWVVAIIIVSIWCIIVTLVVIKIINY